VSIDDIDRLETAAAGADRPGAAPDLPLSRTDHGASPLFRYVWPDSEDLNSELRRVVLENMAVSPGVTKSNCGGWHSESNLQLWSDPAITTLMQRAKTMMRAVVRSTVDDPGPELLENWHVEAWANVNEMRDSAAAHHHAYGLNQWAAIYYVDCGQSPDAVTSGFTRFMDMSGIPRPIAKRRPVVRRSAEISDSSSVSVEGCADRDAPEPYEVQIAPTPGMILVFPARWWHYVTSYLGADKRITIALNLRHTGFVVPDFETPHSRRRKLWRDHRALMLVLFKGKLKLSETLHAVVPVEKWPAGLRRKLLG